MGKTTKARRPRKTTPDYDDRVAYELVDRRSGASFFFRSIDARDRAYNMALDAGIPVYKSAQAYRHANGLFHDYSINTVISSLL